MNNTGWIGKLFFNEEIKGKLETEQALEFMKNGVNTFLEVYKFIQEKVSFKFKHTVDIYLLYTAVASAFIDVSNSASIHNMKNNAPSSEKIGASFTAWLNRIKPIQIIENIGDFRAVFINAEIALAVGLELKWVNENYYAKDKHALVYEVLEETKSINDLIYTGLVKKSVYNRWLI